MPLNLNEDFSYLVDTIDLLKLFYDIGIYDDVTRQIIDVNGDDFYELQLIGLDCVAPINYYYSVEEFRREYPNSSFADTDAYDDNNIQLFSSPEMLEYYRLCRLYEYREGIEPENNPYVIAADKFFKDIFRYTRTYFGADFDDNRYTRMLFIETCPECEYDMVEIIELIHDMLTYYTEQLPNLATDIRLGRFTFLPELPAHKGGD